MIAIFLPLILMNKTHLNKCKKKSTYITTADYYNYQTRGMHIANNSKYFYAPNANLYGVDKDLYVELKNTKNNNYVFINCSQNTYCLTLTQFNYDNEPPILQKKTVPPNTLNVDFLSTVPYPDMVDAYFIVTSQEGACPVVPP